VKSARVSEFRGEVCLEVLIGRRGGNLGRPRELLVALFDLDADGVLDARVHKLDSYAAFDGRLVSMGLGWASSERYNPFENLHAAGAPEPGS
jgi:hypothetical protein